MTGPAISTACPPAPGRVGNPRPWTARGNRFVPPLGGRFRSANSGWFAGPWLLKRRPAGRAELTRPPQPDHGIPDTSKYWRTKRVICVHDSPVTFAK